MGIEFVDSSQELDAMRCVATALDAVPDEARARIVAWAASRYGVRGLGTAPWRIASPPLRSDSEPATALGSGHVSLERFFDAVDPQTESEKALVAGYWLQRYRGAPTFDSATVNRELKRLGHGVRNITAAFSDLNEAKPALAAPTSKGGASQQARKTYTITSAGEKAILLKLPAGGEAGG